MSYRVRVRVVARSRVSNNAQDVILGLGFLFLAAASLRRLVASAGQRGSETVITTFYSLILFTSIVRAAWFLVPTAVRPRGGTPPPPKSVALVCLMRVAPVSVTLADP